MEQARPTLITTEEKNKLPLLIIDKKGTMGLSLANQLHDQFLLVLVSAHSVDIHDNLIHIPYSKKIPRIPDNDYSHMFVFYNGEPEVVEILPALLKKANDSGGKLFFITSLPYSTADLFRRFGHHSYHNMQVILYGEVFSEKGMDANMVTHFLQQAKKHGRIDIPNDGLGKLYPIFLDDVFAAIIATAFGSEKKAANIFLFPNHPISELSIARLLQKQNPLLRVDFKKHKGGQAHYYIPPAGFYFFSDYPLEKKLRLVRGDIKVHDTSIERKLSFPKQKKKKHSIVWVMLFSFLISPLLLVVITGLSGVGAVQLSLKQIQEGKIVQARDTARLAEASLEMSYSIGKSLFYVDFVASGQKETLLKQIHLAGRLAATEVETLQAFLLVQAIMENKSSNPKGDFLQAVALLKNSLITLQKMKAEGELPLVLNNTLSGLSPALQPIENTIDALPVVLGFEGKKRYLVLFQNNMELRPGGGFIGSYGLLEIDKGSVKNFKVHDVYDADGKLTVHLEPPFGLRRYLGASHWFLRDSNFSIDFPENADRAATFLELETGEKVDGVLAVDTNFLKNILSVIGPVTVDEYKETVTADNFYLRTQTHAEKDFFPGSSQKKDFLRSLLAAMQKKLTERKTINHQELVKKIGESILGKHVLFVFSDQATQRLFTVNNLSASLWDGRGREKNTYLDFFGVIDANVGINKTNYYLKRSINQESLLDKDGTIQTTATITYVNTSKKDSPFGGDYKNYLRFVLPPNVALREITIDGQKQPTIDAITNPARFTARGFLPPKELEIESSQEHGKDVVGFLFIVPAGTTKTVTLTYAASQAINTTAPSFVYDLRLFKQPGAQDDPYQFSLTYPSLYKVISKDQVLSDVGGKLVYSDVLSDDRQIRAVFSKK